nr:PREDICTED: uncharacterized protein LOC107075668 [Lepisosteus oculatus]
MDTGGPEATLEDELALAVQRALRSAVDALVTDISRLVRRRLSEREREIERLREQLDASAGRPKAPEGAALRREPGAASPRGAAGRPTGDPMQEIHKKFQCPLVLVPEEVARDHEELFFRLSDSVSSDTSCICGLERMDAVVEGAEKARPDNLPDRAQMEISPALQDAPGVSGVSSPRGEASHAAVRREPAPLGAGRRQAKGARAGSDPARVKQEDSELAVTLFPQGADGAGQDGLKLESLDVDITELHSVSFVRVLPQPGAVQVKEEEPAGPGQEKGDSRPAGGAQHPPPGGGGGQEGAERKYSRDPKWDDEGRRWPPRTVSSKGAVRSQA